MGCTRDRSACENVPRTTLQRRRECRATPRRPRRGLRVACPLRIRTHWLGIEVRASIAKCWQSGCQGTGPHRVRLETRSNPPFLHDGHGLVWTGECPSTDASCSRTKDCGLTLRVPGLCLRHFHINLVARPFAGAAAARRSLEAGPLMRSGQPCQWSAHQSATASAAAWRSRSS